MGSTRAFRAPGLSGSGLSRPGLSGPGLSASRFSGRALSRRAPRARAALVATTVATGLLLSGCAVQQSGDDRAGGQVSASPSSAAATSEKPQPPSRNDAPASAPAPASAEPAPVDTATASSAAATSQAPNEANGIPCTAQQLTGTFSAYRGSDGTLKRSADGSYSGMFQFVNNGPQACTVDGYPGLAKGNKGEQPPITVSHGLSPAPSRVEIPPGGRAAVYVAWFESGTANACYHKIASMEVQLPRSEGRPAEEVSDLQPVVVDIPMSEMTNCASDYNTSAFYLP